MPGVTPYLTVKQPVISNDRPASGEGASLIKDNGADPMRSLQRISSLQSKDTM
jgi:hypothetical protein